VLPEEKINVLLNQLADVEHVYYQTWLQWSHCFSPERRAVLESELWAIQRAQEDIEKNLVDLGYDLSDYHHMVRPTGPASSNGDRNDLPGRVSSGV